MLGGMQFQQMRVTQLIDHAEREHAQREIVTRWADGAITRSNWANIARDARRTASALVKLGMKKGDRIATLAMNHGHHLSVWYGVPGMGGVLHTVNPRLFDDQLVYIMNHAEDRVLFYDKAFTPIVERLKPQLSKIKHFIQLDGESSEYRQLIDDEDGAFEWVDGLETDPCGLCYTSGTTGHPKGVLYEHRSNVLHAISECQPDVLGLSVQSVMLPIVPLFHANAWGVPFSCAAVGAKLVFSAVNDAAALCDLLDNEKVTHSAGVPTVWLAMFAEKDAKGDTGFGTLERVIIGGSAAPRAMIERFMKAGVRVGHAWGMTETSPIGTAGALSPNWGSLNFEQQIDVICKQGRPPYGVELKTVDDEGNILPRDGETSGRLLIRGPWVLQRYFGAEQDAVDADRWFDTGDVAILHPDGTMQITDRSKDVIKSGGEWISSVELENAAMGCPGVAEAAAIGIYHPKWDERPLLVVVRKADADVCAVKMREWLDGKIAKWWMPDAVEFVDEIPHTATGKILKTKLREQFKDYRLDSAE